uniref:OTU domain-containing protein n=1 Tax=viral metagenome TaxID=1070528 RepID=A0A6C0H357_9ZZZZ
MSCLFNSLSYFIKDDSLKIRHVICDYLEQNKSIIDGMQTKEILQYENNNENYIQNMRNPCTWGGAIEIQCACNIWNSRIIVLNNRDNGYRQIEFIPLSGQYERTMYLEWTGGHYEPIRN